MEPAQRPAKAYRAIAAAKTSSPATALAGLFNECMFWPMNDVLLQKASQLPTCAGVYIFRDRRGKVIYIGKAINLRSRVRQYVSLQDERQMVPFLVHHAADVDVVATNTEKEALLLENTLIKQHRPRFNTQLRDDKSFLHVKIDPRSPWPRFYVSRRIQDDGARYFGPYASASQARETLTFLSRHFPLRTCTDAVMKARKRPCILHQMHRCTAPCVGLAKREEYAVFVDEAAQFLDGRQRPLLRRLTDRMTEAAEGENYEEAARVRDLIRAIEHTLEKQQVVDAKLRDRDVWGLHRDGSHGAVAIVPIREGRMGEPRVVMVGGLAGEDAEVLSSLVNAAYTAGSDLPAEILLPSLPTDSAALGEVLGDRRGRRVVVRAPERGDGVKLVQLATQNARVRYEREHDRDARLAQALAELGRLLELPGPPHRIECFDNSNLQGTSPVAAMAVFIDGKPARAEYRRYRVKTVVGADDYATMREILGRRVRRALDEGTVPDLLVVDGGRGQLASALAALRDISAPPIPICGIAKPRTEHARGEKDATDKIILPHYKEPLKLRAGDPSLRILQHIRDEVHDHAVGYHRQVRGRNALLSVLDAIPGVGPARRKALLENLGSARAVADADEETLAAVPGIGPGLARQIRGVLGGEAGG